MIKGMHHLNFIVRDLVTAAERFERLLGVPAGPVESLSQRGVEIVRFNLGGIWLVLVCPRVSDSVPGRFLEEHGEGFFLLSCEVANVENAARAAESAGFRMLQNSARQGLDDWRVMDVDPDDLFGINFQFVQEGG
ncbi:VOC family protein [Elongatibacter sediminis]|uniref:VOC family protein n=1 Tax=Elongatibacter sediminis TaxID=3119006 RepID=A0AAW9RJS4_9GAMM